MLRADRMAPDSGSEDDGTLDEQTLLGGSERAVDPTDASSMRRRKLALATATIADRVQDIDVVPDAAADDETELSSVMEPLLYQPVDTFNSSALGDGTTSEVPAMPAPPSLPEELLTSADVLQPAPTSSSLAPISQPPTTTTAINPTITAPSTLLHDADRLALDAARAQLTTSFHGLRVGLSDLVKAMSDMARQAWVLTLLQARAHPTFGCFLTVSAVMSVLPVGVFLLFAASTLVGGLMTAEGSLLGLGLAILIPVEAGIMVVAAGAAIAYVKGGSAFQAIQDVAQHRLAITAAEMGKKAIEIGAGAMSSSNVPSIAISQPVTTKGSKEALMEPKLSVENSSS
ncbi:hypothetical protein HK101_010645 [Irineochytrium annulatum]|nr:hypothetical protein HK101_010645 [Irineochytrium annulatum]